MELLGKWTGVCYYESTRAFVLDNTMKLSILIKDDIGNLRGIVTEICENPGMFQKRKRKDIIEENVFQLSGKYDETDGTLSLRGVCQKEGRRMRECVLELALNEAEEKLVGSFRDPDREGDVQKVELYKGEVRRDLKELEEMGIKFLQEMRRQDENRRKN